MLTLHSPAPVAPEHLVVMGANGFVGRATVERAQSAGLNPVALTRAEVDLLSPGAAKRLAAHLTPGTTLVVTSALAPVKTVPMLIDNMRMMQAVIEAVKERPVRHLIYISSDAVYKDSPEPLSEGSCAEPGSLHGTMHLTREVMLKSELPNIKLAFVRPTLIFGPGDPHNGYGPNRFVRLARAGQDIVLFGEGEEQRDHVFIADVAELVWRLAAHEAVGVVNAVSGKVTSFRTVAEMAAERFQPRVRILGSPRQGPMPHGGYRPFDPALVGKLFPDFAPVSLADGLDRMR